jgi:hypothetical protein
VQHLEERNKIIHLPSEAHVPLVEIAQKLQIIRNIGVLYKGNTK